MFDNFIEAVKESLTSRKTKKRLADMEKSVEALNSTIISMSNRLAAFERSIKSSKKEAKNAILKTTSKVRGRSK
jgi:hypothetical protein